MKLIGRILVISAVFWMVAGLLVTVVNASGSSAPRFGGDGPQFRPEGNGNGFRPEGNGNRPEGRRDEFGGGSRWLFDVVKNVGVIAVIVTAIVWLRNNAKKNKRKAVAQLSIDEK